MDLPNDILWIIINALARSERSDTEHDDRMAALASCRLASHALSSLASPLFFSSIQLGSYDDTVAALTEQATKLDQILTNSNIAAWVKRLTLSLHHVSLQDSITINLIATILHRLPHIRAFTLEGAKEILDPRSNDLMSAIQAICRSPNLTRLHLGNVRYFPVPIIFECPNLRCLRLSFSLFRMDDVDPMDDTSSPQLLCLNSLIIDRLSLYSIGSRLSGDMSSANYFPQIKNLRVTTTLDGEVSFNYAWQIMLLASQTLTTLCLSENRVSPRLLRVVSFDLGRLPALRHFTIQYWVSSEEDHDIYYLSRLLSPLSSTSGIEILKIKLMWPGYGNDLSSSHPGWSSLDELLVSDKFVSLTKVILHLEMGVDPGIDDLESEVNSTIPRIEAFFPKVRAMSNTRTLEIDVFLYSVPALLDTITP